MKLPQGRGTRRRRIVALIMAVIAGVLCSATLAIADVIPAACFKKVCLGQQRADIPFKLGECKTVPSGQSQCPLLDPPATFGGGQVEAFTVNLSSAGVVENLAIVVRKAPELLTALLEQFGPPTRRKGTFGGPQWEFAKPAWNIFVLNHLIERKFQPFDYAIMVSVDREREKATSDL